MVAGHIRPVFAHLRYILTTNHPKSFKFIPLRFSMNIYIMFTCMWGFRIASRCPVKIMAWKQVQYSLRSWPVSCLELAQAPELQFPGECVTTNTVNIHEARDTVCMGIAAICLSYETLINCHSIDNLYAM